MGGPLRGNGLGCPVPPETGRMDLIQRQFLGRKLTEVFTSVCLTHGTLSQMVLNSGEGRGDRYVLLPTLTGVVLFPLSREGQSSLATTAPLLWVG